MRTFSHDVPGAALDELTSGDWWDTLTLSEQIEWNLSQVLGLLGQVGVLLHTKEGRPLRWMVKSVDCAFADTDRILEKLDSHDF